MTQNMKGNILLLLTAFIWGCAFVAQRTGMEYIGPLTFNGIRSIVGGVTLLVFLFFRSRFLKNKTDVENSVRKNVSWKYTLLCGAVCGICLFAGTTLQQMGMVYTTAGKAGFITALYIILVPLLGLLLGKKIHAIVWFGVILAIVGLYLLCVGEDFTVNKGDMLVLLCSVAFTFHITFVDKVSQKIDGVVISCIQLFVCGLISLPGMLLTETIDLDLILQCAIPILYAGVLSCGVAYTLQIVAQKYTEPTVASMIMSLESVFALLSGMIILKEKISMLEMLGCVLMFIAIILAQLPEKKNEKK
ncbi:MAG: DMT family transporter [Lachnospiraceae bacterium]|nr:DMT family transporter [Lachnospiraceae bacterium]